jgi:hypothetical protein
MEVQFVERDRELQFIENLRIMIAGKYLCIANIGV